MELESSADTRSDEVQRRLMQLELASRPSNDHEESTVDIAKKSKAKWQS